MLAISTSRFINLISGF